MVPLHCTLRDSAVTRGTGDDGAVAGRVVGGPGTEPACDGEPGTDCDLPPCGLGEIIDHGFSRFTWTLTGSLSDCEGLL